MADIATEIRDYAKKTDPESTFSGEDQWNLEIDADYLDYTWNWNYGHYPDCQPFTSVFPSPRINCIVSQSALTVKRAFCNNLYLSVFPRKLNSVNGSDWIVNYPQLSTALKQCSKLRKQFLHYFTDGTLIGNCILSEVCPNTIVSAYILPDKVLMILVNQTSERRIDFNCDLKPWLKSASGKYTVKVYDVDGKLVKSLNIDNSAWRGTIGPMKHLDIALFELIAR